MDDGYFRDYVALDACGVNANTNKASRWIDHQGQEVLSPGLLFKYEHFLSPFRNRSPISVLELGAGIPPYIGASMRCWKAYFRDGSDLHVVDIQPEAADLEDEGFHTHIGDLGDPRFLASLSGRAWDFVLDDASHYWHHQILAFRHLFPSVKAGGIYIVEDLCTSFGAYRGDYGFGLDQRDAVDYFLAVSRSALGGNWNEDRQHTERLYEIPEQDYTLAKQVDMIAFMPNSCIIVKRG